MGLGIPAEKFRFQTEGLQFPSIGYAHENVIEANQHRFSARETRLGQDRHFPRRLRPADIVIGETGGRRAGQWGLTTDAGIGERADQVIDRFKMTKYLIWSIDKDSIFKCPCDQVAAVAETHRDGFDVIRTIVEPGLTETKSFQIERQPTPQHSFHRHLLTELTVPDCDSINHCFCPQGRTPRGFSQATSPDSDS